MVAARTGIQAYHMSMCISTRTSLPTPALRSNYGSFICLRFHSLPPLFLGGAFDSHDHDEFSFLALLPFHRMMCLPSQHHTTLCNSCFFPHLLRVLSTLITGTTLEIDFSFVKT